MSIISSNSYIRVKDGNGIEHIIYPVTKAENIEGLNEVISSGNFATKEYVDTAIRNLINASPEELDTLKELAIALGNDPNFANTVLRGLSEKADKNHTHNYSDIVNMPVMSETDADTLINEIFG